MTIESDGQEFTFEGRLTSTEITIDRDCIDVTDPWDSHKRFIPSLTTYNISLEIVTREVVRTAKPKKAKNVQR